MEQVQRQKKTRIAIVYQREEGEDRGTVTEWKRDRSCTNNIFVLPVIT